MSEKAVATQWKPGQSGNPLGRPKGRKNHLTALKQELEIAVRDHMRPEKLKKIIDTMVTAAIEGNVAAAKLVLDKVLSNASVVDDEAAEGGTFVFKVKNLTLKHPDAVEVVATDAIEGEFVEVTPTGDSMSTGAVQSNQAREQNSAGGNLVGKAPSAPARKVPDFMGKSGQPDNQSTNRGTGGK